MQISVFLLLAVVLAFMMRVPSSTRLAMRLVLGWALTILVFLESPSILSTGYLAIPGFLLGLASGSSWLDRAARGACTAAAVALFPQILDDQWLHPALGASLPIQLLSQAAASFVVGTLLQVGTREEIVSWQDRAPAILKTQAACWTLAAVIHATR